MKLPSWVPSNPQQNREEFEWLLDHMSGATSMLEIGSCLGVSLQGFATRLAPGAKIRSIDAGICWDDRDGEPVRIVTANNLLLTIQELDQSGFDATVIMADSTWPQVIEWARENGPYDFVYIDGGHQYETVKSDFENYAPMATKLIGMHDIANIAHATYGVVRFWNELKANGYRTQEKIESYMGTGIVMQGPRND